MYPFTKPTAAGLLCLYVLLAASCRKNDIPTQPQPVAEVSYSETPTPAEAPTLHTDTAYQYEFRTGGPSHYKYNYDVTGTDDLGNPITGNVSMQGKYGAGVLVDKDGNEIEVTLEWVDYGELKAEDEEGNLWELEVE